LGLILLASGYEKASNKVRMETPSLALHLNNIGANGGNDSLLLRS